ncbi:UNVERIFIED_CONTAM: hypothetical protein GTU68_013782, partial [Idotea baltica]|nr:hypothetical protein [Idotea baltica]
LCPRRVKHRKSQRGRIRGNATRGNTVVFGEFGLQSTQAGHVSSATMKLVVLQRLNTFVNRRKAVHSGLPGQISDLPTTRNSMVKVKASQITGFAVVKLELSVRIACSNQRIGPVIGFNRVAHKLPIRSTCRASS